jgi:hypothetical protein
MAFVPESNTRFGRSSDFSGLSHLPIAPGAPQWCLFKILWMELQQRVLFRFLTGFPFHATAFRALATNLAAYLQ